MLEIQRKKASFNVEALSHIMHNGKDKYQIFQKLQEKVRNDPILKFNPATLHIARSDMMLEQAKKTLKFHQTQELNMNMEIEKNNIFLYQMPLSIHAIMFLTTLQNLCDKEQEKMFLEPALRGQIMGCYCQTQLAHGSDVQSLMTTATYDRATETFIINTPEIGATKWWVGDLGLYCNHAAVFAQLIIDGKKYGVHAFLVPIRDPKTLQVLKGIEAGDIGPKYNFQTKDNGYAIFNNYRIPRKNMLMKYHVVSKEGKYSIQGDQKISFATMLMTRSGITVMTKNIMTKNTLIITRYSLLRTQFKDTTGKQIPVLNYQTQLEKVIPRIAQSFSAWFTAKNIAELSEFVFQEAKHGRFDRLYEAHILASSTKATLSYQILRGGQIIRRAAGGHGFNSYGGISTGMIQNASAFTLEGQYTILLIQVGRFLFKSLLKLQKGKPLAESAQYLNLIKEGNLQVQPTEQNVSCPFFIQKILQSHSCAKIMAYASKVTHVLNDKKLTLKQIEDYHAGNLLNDAAVAHSYAITYSYFLKEVTKIADANIKAVLTKVLVLYGIEKIIERSAKFYQTSTLKPESFALIYNKKLSLLSDLRPEALALMEAFGFDDNIIQSAIGSSNGKPYENLIHWAKEYNPLNKKEQRDQIIKTIKETKLQLRPRL